MVARTRLNMTYVIGTLPVLFAIESVEEGGTKTAQDACVTTQRATIIILTKWEFQ